ncbi:hypothetical protein KFE25_007635 [Diacronema lutheri]|uniref:Uncharacterized protein n=1 Tax=Diacronema lutheri TaxID=2081491 RepID=A0A8J6CBS9_DIALT|nr:hypothetical protein KFE25_007635 [Diacronema lutheri]
MLDLAEASGVVSSMLAAAHAGGGDEADGLVSINDRAIQSVLATVLRELHELRDAPSGGAREAEARRELKMLRTRVAVAEEALAQLGARVDDLGEAASREPRARERDRADAGARVEAQLRAQLDAQADAQAQLLDGLRATRQRAKAAQAAADAADARAREVGDRLRALERAGAHGPTAVARAGGDAGAVEAAVAAAARAEASAQRVHAEMDARLGAAASDLAASWEEHHTRAVNEARAEMGAAAADAARHELARQLPPLARDRLLAAAAAADASAAGAAGAGARDRHVEQSVARQQRQLAQLELSVAQQQQQLVTVERARAEAASELRSARGAAESAAGAAADAERAADASRAACARALADARAEARAAEARVDARTDELAHELRAELSGALNRVRGAARAEGAAAAIAAIATEAPARRAPPPLVAAVAQPVEPPPPAETIDGRSVGETVRAHAAALRAVREHLARHEEVQQAVARGLTELRRELQLERDVVESALGGGRAGRAGLGVLGGAGAEGAVGSAADAATARASARDALVRADAAVLGVRQLEAMLRERMADFDGRLAESEGDALRTGEEVRALAGQQARLSELHASLAAQLSEVRKLVAHDLTRLAARLDGKADADVVGGKADGADVERLHASMHRLLAELSADPARLYAHRRFYSSRPHLLNAYRVAPVPGGGLLWQEDAPKVAQSRPRAHRARSAASARGSSSASSRALRADGAGGVSEHERDHARELHADGGARLRAGDGAAAEPRSGRAPRHVDAGGRGRRLALDECSAADSEGP